ncbi:SDR family NAD(P)-dependent oxidoreductase, partial [Moorena sp. SIO3F7]
QGFEAHQYDVIIAANVLHATTDMKQTLSHVRELLADGGMLVLSEATAKTIWVDLVFGLLEGWWKFRDYELRPDYPLLSRDKWHHVLRETGFTEVVTMPEVEGMAETLSEQAVIVAQGSQRKLEERNDGSKSWLILADSKGVGQKLANLLRSKEEVCSLVFAGEKYEQIAPGELSINPHQAEDFEKVIQTVAGNSRALYGVVQCWTTEAGVVQAINSEELRSLSKLGCGTTLSLVQALVKGGLSTVPRLWLVTSGAQAVPDNHPIIPGVAQSSVWGMGKVISLEHPELNCTCIDLDPEGTIEGQADALFDEIWSEDREDQVAWRGDSRYVARLVASSHRQPVTQQADAKTQKSLSFRSDASYLITEGMAGLGLLVANWMVSKGAKHLVLLGHSSPDDASRKKITELEMAGVSVVVEKADVSDGESMRGVWQRIEESNRPLAGVIHSGGMLSDGVLKNQSWSSFERVMAPKVQGAWHLHQLSQNQSLDFFVLFSSVASLLGSAGQGNHSSANAFLDGLAHYRRAQGLPGLSIHWGGVSQVEEAAKGGSDVKVSKQEMGVISPAQVLESLELLMSGSDVEVGVMPIEWSGWQERVARWPFLADFWERTTSKTTKETKDNLLLEQLKSVSQSEREKILIVYIQKKAARVLGIKNHLIVDIDKPLNQMGLDSLMSIDLRNQIQSDLEVDVPITTFMEGISIATISNQLNEQLNQSDRNLFQTTDKRLTIRRIKPISLSEHLFLSEAQKWMYFWDQFSPETRLISNILMLIKIEGLLNITALEQAFNEIIRRHEILRTSFPIVDGKPIPVISTVANINLSIVELPSSPEQATQLKQLVSTEAKKPFDLAQGPLLRATLVQLSPETHILVLSLHHIIVDGWSAGILSSELYTLYEAYSQGKPSPLSELPIQYTDYAHWERQTLTAEVLEEHLSYWRQKLAGTFSISPLLTDRRRPEIQSFQGGAEIFQLNQNLIQKLTQLGQGSDTTLFTTLLSAFIVLLYNYSREPELIIGAAISNRTQVEIEPLIGMFAGMLAIRSQCSDDSSFTQLLTQVKQTTQEAYKHQDLPFKKLVEELLPESNFGENPLVRVYFDFINLGTINSWKLPGLRVTSSFEIVQGTTQYDLTVVLWEAQSGSGIECHFVYNTDIFDGATITRMMENFLTLLKAIVANPQEKISKLPLITAAEKQKILQEWNNTKTDYPTDKCIHQLFENVVEKNPDAVALIFEDRQLTYAQLNEKANQLAHHLLSLGIIPETPIGIYIDPTVERIVGLLAILKAGGAYVAIDPTNRSQDLQSISVILTLNNLKSEIPESNAQILCLDNEWELIAKQNTDNPNTATTVTNLAYILNPTPTRASCLLVEHQAVVQRLQWLQETLKTTNQDIVLHKTSLSQDVALLEIVLPLIGGGSVVIAANNEPTELQKLISQHKITIVHLYPSELPTWLNTTKEAASLKSWHTLLCSGETLSTEIANKFIESYPVSLHNFYSLPEAGGEVTHWQWLEEPPRENVPVGKPGRLSVYVLDKHQDPVPTGVPGEIYIGGSSLARGYLHQQQQTSQKFIEHPQLGKLFQTGDIGRYHNQGYLEIIDAKQRHTWIQGKRIELADIETALLSVAGVEQAYVLVPQTFLVAYVVVAGVWNPQQLQSEIQQQLPPYMMPGAYVPVSSLPLTHEGKVDEVALAHFPVSDNETERKIAQKRLRGSHVYLSPANDNGKC